MTVVALERVDVRFGTRAALTDVQLRITAGERVALTGPNGSGKSTLLRLINGLLAPSVGTVQAPALRRQAMLFQRPWLLRTSALNNVALGAWLRGTPWPSARARARTALAAVGLAEAADRRARTLSGGQQQRVALARAWALQPDLLLLDEPATGLDADALAALEVQVLALAVEHGTTVVFASHVPAQVARLAQRVVRLEAGRIVADEAVAA